MRTILKQSLMVVVLLSICNTQTKQRQHLSAEEVFKKVAPFVYSIQIRDSKTHEVISRASAVAAVTFDIPNAPRINEIGSVLRASEKTDILVTNAHVVLSIPPNSGNSSPLIVEKDSQSWPAEVLYVDMKSDLAWIKVYGLDTHRAEIRDYSSLKEGEKVYAVGNPRGLELTISDGIISGLRIIPNGPLVQTNAAISAGSSGGGLFDDQGRLIGITSFDLRDSQNLNFAISANMLVKFEVYQGELLDKAGELIVAHSKEAPEACYYAFRSASDNFRRSLAKTCSSYYYLEIGETQGALAYAKEALQLDPNNASAEGMMGLALEKDGKFAEALTHLEASLRMDPGNKKTQGAVRRLQEKVKAGVGQRP